MARPDLELARALDRALSRNVKVAVYTRDMFLNTPTTKPTRGRGQGGGADGS